MINNKEKIMKKTKIILTIATLLALNTQASIIDDIKEKTSDVVQKVQDIKIDDVKEKAGDVWEKTKEITNEIKESNTTKNITSATKEKVSAIQAYVKPDENQSVLDKTKQIGNEAIEYVKDTYKNLVK